MRMLTFTQADGTDISINPDTVTYLAADSRRTDVRGMTLPHRTHVGFIGGDTCILQGEVKDIRAALMKESP